MPRSSGAFLALLGMALPPASAGATAPRVRGGVRRGSSGPGAVLAPAGLWSACRPAQGHQLSQTIGEMDPEGSGARTVSLLQTAVRMVEDHPVLGVGLGAYAQAKRPAIVQPWSAGHATTTYLNIAAENWPPGLVLSWPGDERVAWRASRPPRVARPD